MKTHLHACYPLQVPVRRYLWQAIVTAWFVCLAIVPVRAIGAVSDNFESYAVGSNLHGQGGWAGWADNANAGALVSSSFSFSPTRSVNINGNSDLVRRFSGATNGHWRFSLMQYVPSTSTGTNYVVLMNTYRPPYGPNDLNWSVQIQNNLTTGQVISDLGGGASLPMIKDQWVEVRCEINLASNTVSEFYNGQLLSTHAWQGSLGVPGLNEIQALDLFANNSGPVYYDSMNLTDQGLVITVDLGRKSTGCTGFGICNITIDPLASARPIPTTATWNYGRLKLSFLTDPPGKTAELTIDEDIVLDSATARGLGYQQVIVRAGQYPADYSQTPYGEISPNVTALGLVITIDVGRPSQGCTGFGICSITVDPFASARPVPTAATWNNGRLLLNFLAEPPDKTNVFVVEQDVVLDGPIAQALGYEHITLRAGQYPVDYSVNPHGQVSPDVITQGIIIRIKVGRGGCVPGFGICEIYIGSSASLREVPTAATWVNGRLHLNLLTAPPDKTNVMVIDQDIVLDSATARALGYKQVTVRAGQYPVDYSQNPHGEVSPDVTAQGIVITINVGRQSQGCTGFGICSIVIDLSLSARNIPAAATWDDGRLLLNFLAEPPDKAAVLTIDEDIVLDSATAQTLGYQQITVRAGQYPVDYSVNPHGQVSPTVSAIGITVDVEVGRRSKGCTGFGICSITIDASLRSVPTAATWNHGRLFLNFLAELPDKTNVMVIDEDIVLDSATARALGYQEVTIRAGQYTVDYSQNPHGEVSPDVTARGFVVRIKVGVRNTQGDCVPGFGICEIYIGPSANLREVPAAATWVNGRLHFNFLSSPPDKTNVITIDEDIVLDSATARALSYQQLTVRAGQYPVNYSVNPHGDFTPDVTTQGLVITVDIGRQSQGCTSFGICSITIDPLASARAVQAAATLENGLLRLSFLADPVDQTNMLVIDEDIVLDSATARALGYAEATLRAGQYPVVVNPGNPYGEAKIIIGLGRVIITIETGHGTNCTGFGICSISIDASASPRAVPAVASWNNGRLMLNYMADPPDKTNVLVISQDIVLDSATARALGYEHVTLRAGQYPVDYSLNPHGEVSPDVTALGVVITIEVGRRSKGCTGFGVCSIDIDVSLSARNVPAAGAWQYGRLHFNFLSSPPDKTNVITIDEDIVLDSATARALGYQEVTIRAGQYPVNYSVNPNGDFSPDVTARGITITINVGRQSQGCTGFGICSIVIDLSLSARNVPAAATWENGRLHFNFLSSPPDKTNVITIDEDIVLDSATARALGYQQLTVRAGQYPVDYSVNPHGDVSPDVIAQGLTIWIQVGFPSQGCHGFSICGVGTGTPPWERTVQAAATWINGGLQLSFLSEPPDKTNVMILEEDVVLDTATSRQLGYEQIIFRAGQYPMDYSTNPHGQVNPDISARGLTITIYVGRYPSCNGFGICGIVIDTSANARAVQAAATVDNGRLHLNFLTEPPDKTNVLTIDQDIVLTSAVARKLGYEQVVVRAGQYPVDYSVNPHGQVSPDVLVQGIGVTIYVGRPSIICSGFGICKIDIDLSASARAIQAGATWSPDGRLHLNFWSEPPDKTNILFVEQDLVLDSATSRALGHEQVTIRAGQYPMNFTQNPFGQVSPDSLAQDLAIVPNANGTVTITWPNIGWILQEASSLSGGWTNSPTQTGSMNLLPSETQKFYRLTSP